jgi:hypothetical protein
VWQSEESSNETQHFDERFAFFQKPQGRFFVVIEKVHQSASRGSLASYGR